MMHKRATLPDCGNVMHPTMSSPSVVEVGAEWMVALVVVAGEAEDVVADEVEVGVVETVALQPQL